MKKLFLCCLLLLVFAVPNYSTSVPSSSRCHVMSLLPLTFHNRTVHPFMVDDCDTCAVWAEGAWNACNRQRGKTPCDCATAAAQMCTESALACAPCQVCVNWAYLQSVYCNQEP